MGGNFYTTEVSVTSAHTMPEGIAATLRRRILSGEYPRGSWLRQADLAHDFSMSITPVREALRSLESEGLVVLEPHRGARVAGVDLDRVSATYITRRLVESYAMKRATIRVSALDKLRAGRILDKMQEALDRSGTTSDEVRALNKEFHFLFFDRCGLPRLSEQIEQVWLSFPWDLCLDSPERSSQSLEEHRKILHAVESQDLTAVEQVVEQHILSAFSTLVFRVTGEIPHDPFDLTAPLDPILVNTTR